MILIITKKCLNIGIFLIKICRIIRGLLWFKFMNLLASFAIGGFVPSAAYVGIGSMVLFGLLWIIVGPNYSKLDPDQ